MDSSGLYALADRDVIPTDEFIATVIGERNLLWLSLLQHLKENFSDISGSWIFYNDGKQWLYKMVMKKKTLFWARLYTDAYKITFYFGDSAEPMIEASDLPGNIKDEFKFGQRYGKIRALSFKLFQQADLDLVEKTIAIKVKIK